MFKVSTFVILKGLMENGLLWQMFGSLPSLYCGYGVPLFNFAGLKKKNTPAIVNLINQQRF